MQYSLRSIYLILTLLFQLSACTSNSPKDLSHTKPFQFDPRQVVELTIAKADPKRDDHWLATFRKEKKRWDIVSAPSDINLLDRVADETFIFHLLDVMQNIQIEKPSPRGSLDSFGLEPPKFAVQWKTAQQSWELQVGSYSEKENMTHITLNGREVYLATGTALKMLDLIDSFKKLRKTQWTSVNPDNIDEIQFYRHKKSYLYAQREGDQWTDKNHKIIKKDLESSLRQMTDSQVLDFVDDLATAKKIQTLLDDQPLFEIQLSDRHGQKSVMKFLKYKNQLYGVNTTRPSAIFVLNNNLLRTIELQNQ